MGLGTPLEPDRLRSGWSDRPRRHVWAEATVQIRPNPNQQVIIGSASSASLDVG
jgi:hypothetical protein